MRSVVDRNVVMRYMTLNSQFMETQKEDVTKCDSSSFEHFYSALEFVRFLSNSGSWNTSYLEL